MTHGKSHEHISKLIGIGILTIFLLIGNAFGQTDQSNVKFTQGTVNESATLSLGVPLGNYPGRGLDLPISLNYSSSVWRIEHLKSVYNSNAYPGYGSIKQSVTQAIYAEYSTAGWKSSLELPKIEFPKLGDVYDYRGRETLPEYGNGCFGYRIARVFIHLPDGSMHELRKSDVPYQNASAVDMTGTFYAIDGSRMRYDSTGADTGTLYLADGTRYVLGHPTSTIIDRNGNTQSYNETSRQWTDTLGRVMTNPIPVNPQAQDYSYNLPGLNGGLISYTVSC